MPKTGISVTLDERNLLWLKARTLATRGRSISETLDQLVSAARASRATPDAAIRSVVGTIEIADEDPNLDHADVHVRDLMNKSLGSTRSARVTTASRRAGRTPQPKRKRRA